MADWTTSQSSAKVGTKDHISLPSSTTDHVLEQAEFCRDLAYALIQSKVLGAGSTWTIALSGTSNKGHPNGDTVTITVTNAN